MENNYLSQKQEIQKNQELANCPNVIDKTAKEIKWLLVSAGQNGSVVVGVIAGTPVALVEVGCDIAQAVRHPIDTCSGLKKLLGSWESLCDFPQLLEQALDAQYNKMTHELERAGIAGSFKGGIEAARLGMDVTLLGGSVRSVLNAGKSLTGTSIKLSINSAEMVKTFGLPGAIKTGVQSTANAAKSTIHNVSSGVSQTVKQTVKVAQALVKSSAAKQASSVAEKGAQCFKKVSKSSSGVSTHSHVPRKNLSTSLSRSEKAIGKNSFAAINTSEKPIEGISFPLDFSSNIVIEDSVFKFNKIESKIISEAKCILNSPEISKIKNAHGTGKPITIKIGNRIIQYEPSLPASGMTMFGDNGFLIGNEAFTSIQEFRKTILHELYRLQTSKSSSGVSKTLAAQETKSAADFASNAVSALESIK